MAGEGIAIGARVSDGSAQVSLADGQPRSGSAIVAAALAQPIQTAELSLGIQLFGPPRYPRHDRDWDGIPDRRDRDRDGDGLPNHWDPNPNRPNYPYPLPPPRRFERPCYPYERPDYYNRFGQPRCYGRY